MKILFLLFCLSIGYAGYSQSKNQQRIQEINTEIEKAVEKSDFDKAKTLKEEKDIRLGIEEAIKNGDFDKAEQLKNSLENKQPEQNVEDYQVVKQDNPQVKKGRTTYGDSYQLNKSIKRGVYMNLNVGSGGVASGFGGGWGINLGADLGVRIGKYDYHKRYRIIFDLELLNFSAIFGGSLNLYNLYYEPDNYGHISDSYYARTDFTIGVGLIKPGVNFSYAINQNIGIETSFHVGAHVAYFPIEYEDGSGGDFGAIGIELDPRFMFRIKGFGIGVKFVYAHFMDLSQYAVGWGSSFRITPTIGVKF